MNRKKVIDIMRNNGILLVILLLIIVTGIFERNFLTFNNLLNVLRQVAVVGIVACGMTYCIIGGAFDLSVGSVVSLAGVITILSINNGTNEYLAVLYGLSAGVAVGIINGVLISLINGRTGEAFIVTYGMQVVVAAIALFPSRGLFISGRISPGFFKSMGEGVMPIVIFLGIAAFMEFVLVKTKYGRTMSFIGYNLDVAKMSGLNVKLNRISYFAISGLLAGLGGVVLCSRVTSSNPTAGLNFEMDVIAAVVVGGTQLSGGSGSVGRTVIGAVIIGIMGNALNILGITAYHQQIVKGMLILLAVGMDILNKQIKLKEMAHDKVFA
ncbi:MAG: ABC transporter permease [Sphaerochaetaceae bacterium]|jgi:ribose/xylose/arabinose/galactoside ABC-type transport system permease subunit|nr:ABC transporter permease [Sphaerochaetaceae bacterium]MDY0371766.1 ABC transporter permease [Sphaerochaetaceae bacterium]